MQLAKIQRGPPSFWTMVKQLQLKFLDLYMSNIDYFRQNSEILFL